MIIVNRFSFMRMSVCKIMMYGVMSYVNIYSPKKTVTIGLKSISSIVFLAVF